MKSVRKVHEKCMKSAAREGAIERSYLEEME